MLRNTSFTLTALLLATVTTLPVWSADIITRRDGTRVAGSITGGTKADLTIKPTIGEPVTISSSEIVGIEWDKATAELKLAISDENAGRLDSALQRATKSKSESTEASDLLRLDFDFILARIAYRMAMADPGKLDAAITQLQSFCKTASDHFRYYDATNLLGQLQFAKGDMDGAKATFEQLAQSPAADYKLAAQISQGRILAAQGQNDQANQAFDAAISTAGNSSAEQARKFEAMLGKARSLLQQNKNEEALPVIEEVISKSPANDTAVQAEAYVLQGNALQSLNRNKEAVIAYLHVDILFPRESGFHAEALYHMSRLWKLVQAPERGLDAEAKLTSAYPNNAWTKKLAGGGSQ